MKKALMKKGEENEYQALAEEKKMGSAADYLGAVCADVAGAVGADEPEVFLCHGL